MEKKLDLSVEELSSRNSQEGPLIIFNHDEKIRVPIFYQKEEEKTKEKVADILS
jgi:hypothetical protein